MSEDFFQYLWKIGMFQPFLWETNQGDIIQIKRRGNQNEHSGPDFLNAEVLINGTPWFGHIELHIHASDWYNHKHQNDPAYNNVVLHVVLDNDKPTTNQIGSHVPTIEIKDKIPAGFLSRYKNLRNSIKEIPCETNLYSLSGLQKVSWMDRMGVERISKKADRILELWKEFDKDWEKTVFYLFAKYVGGKVNQTSFKELAHRIDLRHIWKSKSFIQQLEAYFLGLAGLLEGEFDDVYPNLLKREYAFLKKKWGLQNMQAVEWQFFRMRPSNFPTLRIAQLAKIYHTKGRFFPWILDAHVEDLEKELRQAPSAYWMSHYLFDKKSDRVYATLGKSQFDILLINVVMPLRFAVAMQNGDEKSKEQIIEHMRTMPSENNKIIRLWKKLGIESKDAFDSQALIELKKEWCDKKRCLECAFGNYFLSNPTFSNQVEESYVSWIPDWVSIP